MTDDSVHTPLEFLDDDDEHHGLPEHEQDDERTVGGGVMASGGTAIDRGTGMVDDADAADEIPAMNAGVIPGPPSGGPQPYVPGVFDDDEDGGVLPDA